MRLLAYLDPGSGSILLQALLGGAAGIMVALKLFGRRVVDFLTFRRHRPEQAAPPDPDPDGG